MSLIKIGVIGDIHTCFHRLKNTIQFLKNNGIETILSVGDIVDGKEGKVNECVSLLKKNNIHTVLGNHDRWLFDSSIINLPYKTEISTLTNESIQFLKNLPPFLSFNTLSGRVILCHGIGKNDLAYIYPKDSNETIRLIPEFYKIFKSKKYSFIINGHSHRKINKQVENIKILNPGTLLGDNNSGFMILNFQSRVVNYYSFLKNNPFLTESEDF